ncbi:MAG: glycosyltransferase family 4 protein [Actinomycetota bacterium]|nr:glycosyltransferase family 4 protein [Actinomycetota bacterium]
MPATSPSRRPRVVFVGDIPTPYVVPWLRELAELVDLTAIFAAARGSRGQAWDLGDLGIHHVVLDGKVLERAPEPDVHIDPRLALVISRARPDVVLTPAFALATAWAVLTGRRVLPYSDGTARTEANLGPVQLLARRLLVRRVSGCVGHSHDAAARMRELGCPREAVFRVPFSTELRPLRDAAAARTPAPAGQLRALVVARLIRRKGVDAAIEAVARARREVPGMTLDVVGAGTEEPLVQELASRAHPEGIRFHGFVDQPDLPVHFRDADVLLFPSRRDQFGIVVLEGAAAALPIIASPRAGATTELVEDGVSGFVVDPDDIDGMAARLVELARDPALRARLGSAAQAQTAGHEPAVAARAWLVAIDHALTAVRHPRLSALLARGQGRPAARGRGAVDDGPRPTGVAWNSRYGDRLKTRRSAASCGQCCSGLR